MPETLLQSWFKPIDAAALAIFRIMLGGVLLFESVNYGLFLCLDCLYREPQLLFKYHYFEWVKMLPGTGLEIVFLVMAICAIGIMLGLYYRIAMLIYTMGFTYHFLLDQALYLNHFYLTIIICCIMSIVPANRLWSIDARRNPTIASSTVPNWTRIWLVAQLEIVLIYAGLVKLNWDWLNLEPMRLWMVAESKGHHPIFTWLTQDPGIALASYGVIVLHLVGAPLLLWKKTRLPVFLLYCVFHSINAMVFDIGIFPFLTVAATLLFFDPSWPRQFVQWLKQTYRSGQRRPFDTQQQGRTSVASGSTLYTHGIVLLIVAWLLVQVLVPLRHWTQPGSVAWNEAGHRFSWRMKLRDKRGTTNFYVMADGKKPIVENGTAHLTYQQRRIMGCIPDLIWQYAQFLEKEYTAGDSGDVKVFVDARCSLNTREEAQLINRLVDLTSIRRDEPVQNWILPLTKPLPKKVLPI